MSREVALSLSELVHRMTTRTRGQEAVQAIRNRAAAAGASQVLLDMRTDSLVTTSFVDELVRQAAEMEREGLEVVFDVPNDEMLQRFQKSVTWRRITCRYRLSGDPTIHTLQPGEESEVLPKVYIGSKSDVPED